VQEFERLDVQVVGASTDSHFSHLAWLQTPRKAGGIEGVTYPIISDFNKTVARDYDVLTDEGVALRGAFLIDREGIVRSQVVNDLPLGRNIDELLRTVKALQFNEEHGEVCPANWNEGDEGMTADSDGLRAYFERSLN
jgi:peroxiredoxin (alkyl hydroperoxide reductase subunit C)